MGGGDFDIPARATGYEGPSPRGRGRPHASGLRAHYGRTIPAWAGETNPGVIVDSSRKSTLSRTPIVHERLLPGDVVLAHHGGQPPFETAKQIAEAAVAGTLRMDLSIFLPEDRHRDARTLELARQGRPVRLGPPPLALRDPSPPIQPRFQSLVGDVVRQRPCQPGRRRPLRLSWIVERATPRRRPISRALTPSWRSRNRCRNCRMLSSRFAGIPISSSIIDEAGALQLLNRGEQTVRP